MKINQLLFNAHEEIQTLSLQQQKDADLKATKDVGTRSGIIALVYPLLLFTYTFISNEIRNSLYFWLPAVAILAIVSFIRFYYGGKINKVSEQQIYKYRLRYFIWTFISVFLLGLSFSMVLIYTHISLDAIYAILMSLGITAGALATVNTYRTPWFLFLFLLWSPIIVTLLYMSSFSNQSVFLLTSLIFIFVLFIFKLGNRLSQEYWRGHRLLIELNSSSTILEKTILELEQAKLSSESANQSKSEFLANMSHEIRTPMNAIIGLSKLALRENLGEKEKGLIEKVNSSGHLLLTIINDILDFSKIEANKLDIFNEPFSLQEIFNHTQSIIDVLIKDKQVSFIIEQPEDLPMQLIGDAVRLQQILTNLCNNAAKFTDQGFVKLVVSVKEVHANSMILLFEIIDSGIGMTQEQLDKIFESFSQADITTTKKFGGTGLGLTISKRLVELMGGELSVESELNQGSKFFFSMPLGLAENIEPVIEEMPENIAESKSLKGLRVLLVEDNEFNQVYAEEILEEAGIKVSIAENGQEAIDQIHQNSFDIILMDCRMPVMDGYTATREIRKESQFKQIPIIALTANLYESDIQKALDSGMNDHLGKPFEEDDLFMKIDQWVNRN